MQTITLKFSGAIKLKADRIEFDDKSSRINKFLFKLYPFLFLIFGVYELTAMWYSENSFQLFLRLIIGLLLLSIPALTYHSNFNRTNKKEILLNEIVNVKLKKLLGTILIDFELKGNSTRRVYNIKNYSDWELIKNYMHKNEILCSN